jgi:hypothetical protein
MAKGADVRWKTDRGTTLRLIRRCPNHLNETSSTIGGFRDGPCHTFCCGNVHLFIPFEAPCERHRPFSIRAFAETPVTNS